MGFLVDQLKAEMMLAAGLVFIVVKANAAFDETDNRHANEVSQKIWSIGIYAKIGRHFRLSLVSACTADASLGQHPLYYIGQNTNALEDIFSFVEISSQSLTDILVETKSSPDRGNYPHAAKLDRNKVEPPTASSHVMAGKG